MYFEQMGCEIFTNFNTTLALKDGFYYQNFLLNIRPEQ